MMIARVLTLRSQGRFNLFPIFWGSTQVNKTDILSSQFHSHGIKHFLKSKQLNRSSTSTIFEIDKLITELEKHRMRLAQLREGELIKQEELGHRPQCSKYFETYLKLVQKMAEVKLREEWRYRIVGWYNMQPFLQDLIQELLGQADKSAHSVLIESIHWMKPHQIVYRRDQSVQELIKQKMRLDHFYRQLNYGVSIDVLRQIEGIFGDFVTQCKSKYYHHFLQNTLNSLLDHDNIEDLLWIYEMYVATFNDDDAIITQIQQHLLTLPDTNRDKIARSLIRIYNQVGRISKPIFSYFIKPFLATTPNIIQAQIMNLEFIIHSEVDDEQALNATLKQIAKIARTQPISDGHRLHVHYLLHYLRIKNIKFSFPPTINRQFNEACRTFEEDGTLAKLIAIELDQRSRRQGVDYYNSSCVLKKKHYDFSSNRGEQIKKAEGFRKFSNAKFCCLKLDLCVYEQAKKKAVVLEKNYHRFQHSGKLVRMEEVKADILKHYGFEINYLQPKAESKQA